MKTAVEMTGIFVFLCHDALSLCHFGEIFAARTHESTRDQTWTELLHDSRGARVGNF